MRTCPICLEIQYFPAGNGEQVTEKPDASEVAESLTSIRKKKNWWWKYLPSITGAEGLLEQVEVWCYKCGLDAKLEEISEEGNTFIDHKPKFIFGFLSKPVIYVENEKSCWGPNCAGSKQRPSRMVPIDSDLKSLIGGPVRDVLDAACLDTKEDIQAVLSRTEPSKRSRFDYGDKWLLI